MSPSILTSSVSSIVFLFFLSQISNVFGKFGEFDTPSNPLYCREHERIQRYSVNSVLFHENSTDYRPICAYYGSICPENRHLRQPRLIIPSILWWLLAIGKDDTYHREWWRFDTLSNPYSHWQMAYSMLCLRHNNW